MIVTDPHFLLGLILYKEQISKFCIKFRLIKDSKLSKNKLVLQKISHLQYEKDKA